MLDWSGGCGTRTIRCASTCSNSPRRHPLASLRYSVAEQGRVMRKTKIKTTINSELHMWALCAHTVFAVDLFTPEHRLYFSQTSGAVRRGLSEHVAAQQIVRVPQPPDQSSNAGNPVGMAELGSPSLDYLSWRSKKGNQLSGCPRRC